jgi:hypothetical protein
MAMITDSRTEGERLFEQACASTGISWYRFPVARAAQGHRRPDYKVRITGRCGAIIEVKQFDANEAEAQQLTAGLCILPRGIPGARVRGAIRKSGGQLRRASQLGIPTAVAIFDTMFAITYTDPYNVKVAMYGLDAIVVRAPPNSSDNPVGMKRAGKATLTEEHNTSLSAVIIIRALPGQPPILIVYHNHFARVPFDPDHLRGRVSNQFVLARGKWGHHMDEGVSVAVQKRVTYWTLKKGYENKRLGIRKLSLIRTHHPGPLRGDLPSLLIPHHHAEATRLRHDPTSCARSLFTFRAFRAIPAPMKKLQTPDSQYAAW